ncbi:hypothetical protein BUY60_20910, partial [Staphylococcus epidermidis]
MHYSFLRIKSAKHQSIDGEKSPCRDGLQIADKLHVGERLTCSGLPHHHRVGRIRRICVASGVMCLPPIPGLPETGEKFPRQLKHLDAVV